VVWDSWGYGTAIDEQTLRDNADIAASLGIELFLVDLGWAPRLGDWYADPDRFPSGLRALADYVHSLGMKFGLHFAFAEADAGSEVLQAHPDWTSSESYGYFGAQSLCLSNQATRNWLVDQAVHLIDDYSVDWILQDGQNMVKLCTKDTHSHDPQDSNYANSVEGLNQFVDAVQRQRPSVAWENCENGGSMMTFGMVRRYATSIVNDASGSLAARQAAYGASYPFSPRYIDRYMPESDLQPYVTRSYMLGGPWVFMNRLPDLSDADLAFAASEIRVFKTIRAGARSGKVFHLTPQPVEGEIDALQNYNAASDTAVAVVERADANQSTYLLKPQGLNPDTIYLVRFQDDLRSFIVAGDQLMQRGVQVPLPDSLDAEIVYIAPFQ